MFEKEYLNEKDLDNVLPVREKAHRHLRKWSKQKLGTPNQKTGVNTHEKNASR